MHVPPLLSAAIVGLALSVQPLAAHPGHHEELPESYAQTGPVLSFFSTPNRKHVEIKGDALTTLGAVTVDLGKPGNVLVQFTSGLATVTPEGCPCSVRTSLQVDDEPPVVVKRINLGAVTAQVDGKYQSDRQSADGSFVFPLKAGKHRIALIVQRIEGSSAILHGFYPNLQALVY